MASELIEICRIKEFAKGFEFGPHAHARLEVNYIISGKAMFSIGNEIAVFGAGDCIVLYPEISHIFVARQHVKLLQIEFQEQLFKSTEDQPDKLLVLAGYNKFVDASYIYRCMEQIYHEVKGHRALKDDLLSLYFKELYLLIKRRITEQSRKIELLSASPVLSKALDFIAKNYNTDFSVEELAERLSISSGYMRRLFRQELNTNISSYVNKLRIEKAVELLNTRKYSVSEVAYLSGYSSPQYFSKVFLNKTGMTPLGYVKEMFRKVQLSRIQGSNKSNPRAEES